MIYHQHNDVQHKYLAKKHKIANYCFQEERPRYVCYEISSELAESQMYG